jgi:alginate O-acetyltransferase complex protein AlgI
MHSHSMDVIRGNLKLGKHLLYIFFVSFFQQLAAGSIQRAKKLHPQLFRKLDLAYNQVAQGLKFKLWHIYMSLMLADGLWVCVDAPYTNSKQYQHDNRLPSLCL